MLLCVVCPSATLTSPSHSLQSSAGRLSSGGGGEDLFKTDPFSSVSSGGASSGAATDPFSGQDPFSSDPFATSSDSKNAGQVRSQLR